MSKKLFRMSAIAFALAAYGAPSLAVLTGVDPGPYTAATGFFPNWYQDSSPAPLTAPDGTVLQFPNRLDLCLSKAQSSRVPGAPGAPSYMCTLLPNPGIFDDTQPIVWPTNFPDESFYFTGDATIQAGGIDLVYVSAVEAAFAAGNPNPGDQVVFARIRIRVDVPVAGTYTITHPYGVNTYNVTIPGRRAINETIDVGVAPGIFTGALQGAIGPFLRGVGGPYIETNPDTGVTEYYVGDPNLLEQVTGSPNGTNFVRVQGPNGIDVSTNLFAVSGRMFIPPTPTPLTIERTTYNRTAAGTKIEVFAESEPGATVCFRETVELVPGVPPNPPSPCLVTLAGDGAKFYGADTAPASIPANVIVTATTPGKLATPFSSPLTDVVKTTKAQYARDTGELEVLASSSDETGTPVINALGFGRLTLQSDGRTQRLLVTGLAEPPASVTLVSAAGGRDIEPVTVVATAAANRAPVAAADSATTNEDTLVTIPVLANDSDADGDPLTITAVTAPAHGTAVRNGNAIDYRPNANFNGSDSFSYTISDGRGGTATATVSVAVTPVNDAPVAVADSFATQEDVPLVIPAGVLAANDTDVENDALSVTAVGGAVNGTVSLVGNVVTFTPNANFFGTGSFTYTVSDGQGGSAVGNVTVNVTPVNDAPVAVADAATTAAGVPVTINVLANDSDVDGDVLTITGVSNAVGGTAVISAGRVTFTPNAGFVGTGSFNYAISDGNGGTATASVTVTVTNRPPVAVSDTANTASGTPVTVNVLANDSDPDGNPLTVIATTNGGNGTVTRAATTVTYTPNAGFSGPDAFTYTISDGNGGTATATVSVSVAPGAGVDLDIAAFNVLANGRRGVPISLTLSVNNGGTVNGQRTATIVGVQNGVEIYRQSRLVADPVGGNPSNFAFPAFTPTSIGTITWTATIQDDNPDVDLATRTTLVPR